MKTLSTRSLVFVLVIASSSLGCGGSGGIDEDFSNSGGSQSVPPSGGGTAAVGGSGSGGAPSSGGAVGSGGASIVPVDCARLTTAGYEVCAVTESSCGVVFTDSLGCTALCAKAGLACEAAYENLEVGCGANETLPSLPCDSGHQSDFCLCSGSSSGGTGGNDGSGGSGGAGSGGSSSGGTGGAVATPDCNSVGGATIRVKKSGGDFSTIQAAIDSLSKSNTTWTTIRIAPDTYKEKLVVDRPYVTLCGELGKESTTILTYDDNANTPKEGGGTVGTSGSASTNISASKVRAENLTFANSTPLGGSQAVALLVTGNEVEFRRIRVLSFQDTLYTKSGSQYFIDSYIEGSVDFIFGGATAVFENCTIHSASGGTAVTAPSTAEGTAYGLVFLGGKLTKASSVSSASVALGRNWGAYGAAAFIHVDLASHISAVGWQKMGANTLATARFSEFESTGSGANPSKRAAESKQLSSAEAAIYTVENIFGSWVPAFSP